MNPDTASALATLSRYLPLFSDVIDGIAKVRADELSRLQGALRTGVPMDYSEPYRAGDMAGRWYIKAVSIYYCRLSLDIVCHDATVAEMLKTVLTKGYGDLYVQDVMYDDASLLTCTVNGVPHDLGRQYAVRFNN